MTRRFFLSAAIAPAARRATAAPDDFGSNVARFHSLWDKFIRTYLGCPKGAITIAECSAASGVLDYAEFLKAAKAGRVLFDLPETK